MDESRLGYSDGALMNLGLVCNLRCKHCYFDGDSHKWKPLIKIILNIILIRICRIKRIDLTGGEPTLHPKIKQLVQLCDWIGFSTIRLDTNGTQLELCEELAKNKKIKFSVSVHSNRPRDLRNLTGKDIFNDLVNFFARFESRINYVTVVITPYNTDIENLLVDIRDIVGWHSNAVLCVKFLDYNYCHTIEEFETLKYRDEIHVMIRKLFKRYPDDVKLDMLCYPFCFFDKDVMDKICVSPGVKKCHLEYQKSSVSKQSTVWEWLIMIFGTTKARNELELKIRDRENKTYWMRMPACEGCIESECPGIHKGYYKLFGDKYIVPIK